MKATDINPETGKAYAVRPDGVWDDNYFAQNYGGGGQGGAGSSVVPGVAVPDFVFNYPAAEEEAFKALEPYYRKKLEEAQGDINQAKRYIEEDYALGRRYDAEDNPVKLAADTQTAKEETEGAQTDLNRRGLLFGQIPEGSEQSAAPLSPYAQTQELNPLKDKQMQRRQAIERAISRQEEVAGIDKKRGLEDPQLDLPRFEQALHKEKLDDVRFKQIPYQRAIAEDKHIASYGKYMQGGQG